MVKSTYQVVERVNITSDYKIKPWLARKVLKEEMHMSYRKLKEIPPCSNSDLNKIIR